jgi:undecaprenyl-diphosphatase
VNKENRTLISGAVVATFGAVGFALLAQQVMRGGTDSIDQSVRMAIHAWASPLLTRAMRGVTELGQPSLLIMLGLVIVWRLYMLGRYRAATILAISAIGGEVCDQALKYSFARHRPNVFFGPQAMGYSFPSGHSVEACCFYGVLAAILTVRARMPRKIAIWTAASLLTLAIGISRIYLGVHYPSDVAGGYAVAVVWVALLRTGYLVWLRRRPPQRNP